MQKICACHQPALPHRGGQQQGTVHSVFPKAVNLRMEDGRLLTLALKKEGRGPYCLSLDGRALPAGIQVGDPATLTRSYLRIGGLTLPILENAAYALRRGQLAEHAERPEENLRLLRRRLERADGEKDLGPIAVLTRVRLEEESRALGQALLEGDRTAVIRHGRALLGLGQGLTPSGDDVLTGMFLVLGLEGSPFQGTDQLLGTLLTGCEEQTTEVSWQMLTAAASGYYKEALVEFAEALGGGGDQLRPAAEHILSIGHSSGRDLLLGCLTAWEVLLRCRHEIGE